jgi:hypothetical protein
VNVAPPPPESANSLESVHWRAEKLGVHVHGPVVPAPGGGVNQPLRHLLLWCHRGRREAWNRLLLPPGQATRGGQSNKASSATSPPPP